MKHENTRTEGVVYKLEVDHERARILNAALNLLRMQVDPDEPWHGLILELKNQLNFSDPAYEEGTRVHRRLMDSLDTDVYVVIGNNLVSPGNWEAVLIPVEGFAAAEIGESYLTEVAP